MNPYAHFLEGNDPLKLITATPKRIDALVKGLTPAQMKKRVNKDKWSIYEIVQHLADCELMFASRCRLIAFDDHPHLQPFDQDRWAAGKALERESVEEAINRFNALRRSQIALYKASSPEARARTGHHPERGEVSMAITFETCAGHDVNHLRQIEALRAAVAPAKKSAPKQHAKAHAKKAKRKK